MKKQTDEQEVLQLRQDYLKHSEVYRRFCDFCDKRIFEDQNTPIPEEFDEYGVNQDKVRGCINNYKLFGNIFIGPEVQKHRKKKLWKKGTLIRKALGINKLPAPIESGPVVEDYAKIVESDMDFFIAHLKERHHREPTLQEFKEILLDNICHYHGLLHLRIHFTPGSLNKKDYLKKLEKELSNFVRGKNSKQSRRIRLNELKRYLRVYELRKSGLRTKEIIKKEAPKKDPTQLNVQRAFNMDFRKAEQIIRNVEKGIFPGDY